MHIHWCTSGPFAFLPLHAAGLYNSDGSASQCISDFAISSYTPTLSALLLAQATGFGSHIPNTPGPLSVPSAAKLLAVIQPNTPQLPPLPGTLEELECIKHLTEAANVALIVYLGEQATTAAVLDALPMITIVHFACHGTQNAIDPLESGLHLHDGLLKASDIMSTHLPKAHLAFFSACSIATDDLNQRDEAMHLAAGMLAAGFQNVIGSMWAISDATAPAVAERFYQKLFDGQSGAISIEAGKTAEALHFAIRDLRKEGQLGKFQEWVPFVHFGA